MKVAFCVALLVLLAPECENRGVEGRFRIFESDAKSILSGTSGFIREAGFTHSLTPARNCTFGCTYCYVPTMRIYGGLKPADWQRWGQFTTSKSNAPLLLEQELRAGQIIYCSPLVDPYQPAEADMQLMPQILEQLIRRPPAVFVLQTRGPLVMRDLSLLRRLQVRTKLRVSFSVTTDDERVRRLYEPHCATFEQRLAVLRTLRDAGIKVYATLAPLLPCNPEALARAALQTTGRDLIGDPLHVRGTKRHGATTRDAALEIARRHEHLSWFDPVSQAEVVQRIAETANAAGHKFAVGTEGFSWLSRM